MGSTFSSIRRIAFGFIPLLLVLLPLGGFTASGAVSIQTIPVAAGPDAIVAIGSNIWVASCAGNAVTEINRSTFQVVQVLSQSSFGFDCPDALAFGDGYLWVANALGGSLTQLSASTGAWIQTITGTSVTENKHTFRNVLAPISMVVVKNSLWVGNYPSLDNIDNQLGSFVSEFDVRSGATIGSIHQPFGDPWSLAYTGAGIWVAGGDTGNSELMDLNGREIRLWPFLEVKGVPPLLYDNYLSYHSGVLWVAGDNGVWEYNAKSGKYLRSIHSGTTPAGELVFTGRDLFVAFYSPISAIREYNSSGTLIRTVVRLNSNGYRGELSPIGDALIYSDGGLWFSNYSLNTVAFCRTVGS